MKKLMANISMILLGLSVMGPRNANAGPPASLVACNYPEVNVNNAIVSFRIYGPAAEILYNLLTATKEVEAYRDQYSVLLKKSGKHIVCFNDVTVHYYCELQVNSSGEVLEPKE